MNMSRLAVGSLLAMGATGCLATKGDIRLLQDQLRVSQMATARADSAQRRTSDSLVAALTSLSALQRASTQTLQQSQQKTNDDLKALTSRFGSFEVSTKEQLKSLNDDIDQVREIARQSARGAAIARAQQDDAAAARAAAAQRDTTAVGASTPSTPVLPSSASLLVQGQQSARNSSCSVARNAFQELLKTYPSSVEAPEAQFSIGATYESCDNPGNTVKADSVYKLVTDNYPKSDFAAISLYKRGEFLRTAGTTTEARPLYTRVVCEYPKSTAYGQALDRLGSKPVCR